MFIGSVELDEPVEPVPQSHTLRWKTGLPSEREHESPAQCIMLY